MQIPTPVFITPCVEAITFKPLYMERVWGGCELERVYGQVLPATARPFGESWKIVDCEDAQSVVDEGPLIGKSLHELWTTRRDIGAGFLIHKFQQNSDTAYRVFDWNRLGFDGRPRQLHVKQSLASIDFNDFEPSMDTPEGETIATCAYFRTDRKSPQAGDTIANQDPQKILHPLGGGGLPRERRRPPLCQGPVPAAPLRRRLAQGHL